MRKITYDKNGLGFAEMTQVALKYPRAFKRFERLLDSVGEIALYVLRGFIEKMED